MWSDTKVECGKCHYGGGTDGAGHDYGPHSDGVRDALDETDRRIGRVLALLDERGLGDVIAEAKRRASAAESTTTTTSLVLEICNVQRCPAVPRASSPFVIVISVLLAPAEPTATALPKCTFFVGERAGLALFAPTQLQQY